jgi:sugar O-acyltransferase (sialic acid O-acetyltransferase NeuD family)
MAQLIVFGAGEIAELAAFYFRRDSEHEVVAFAVDRAYRNDDTFCGLPLIDVEEAVERYPPAKYQGFVALSYAGVNKLRAEKYALMKSLGYQLVSYISSHCTWLTEQLPGDNCFILEDNTVQPFVRIGNNVTLWSGNHIGHESVIEDHCFVSSHVVVSGHVTIKPYCFLGVNTTLRNGITIAAETVVGAGAIIMKDTIERGVYMPQRAELFKKRSDEIDL